MRRIFEHLKARFRKPPPPVINVHNHAGELIQVNVRHATTPDGRLQIDLHLTRIAPSYDFDTEMRRRMH